MKKKKTVIVQHSMVYFSNSPPKHFRGRASYEGQTIYII